MVQKQFAEEVVDWAGWVQGEVERQGRELTALKNDLQESSAALLAEVDHCKREMHNDLVRLRALIPDTQKPLQEALRQLSAQVTGMSEDWGKDVTRLMSLSQQAEKRIDTRIGELVAQNKLKHERLHERIEGMTQRQTVLMTSMEAMEAQMRELMEEEKAYMSEFIYLTERLPPMLYEEEVDKSQPRPGVRDSVTSPTGQDSQKGFMLLENPKKPPMMVCT